MPTLTKLPEFHCGVDAHNLPGKQCRIEWDVITTLAATMADPSPEDLASADAFAESKGLGSQFTANSEVQPDLIFKAAVIYQMLIEAATVSRDEHHDLQACSRLASHAVVALNWVPRFYDEDLAGKPQINDSILSILASGDGRLSRLSGWLCDHFATKKPRKSAKGFGN